VKFWDTPWNVSASLTWRFIGSVSEGNNSNDPALHLATFGDYDFYNGTIPSYSYLDLDSCSLRFPPSSSGKRVDHRRRALRAAQHGSQINA
jgi:hypothetical protein